MESRTDQEQERLLAKTIEASWDVALVKMKRFYKFDYAAKSTENNFIEGFVELKCRKTPKDQYADYLISEEKVRWALETWHRYGIPCFLVVGWSNYAGYFTIKSTKGLRMVLSGRMDEHDGAESEPCILIPVKYFEIV
jgi:hypothetical protein